MDRAAAAVIVEDSDLAYVNVIMTGSRLYRAQVHCSEWRHLLRQSEVID